MPTFRTTPSGSLTSAVRRLISSGGSALGPLGEAQADAMAAKTARDMSLAEKARAEVEAMQRSNAERSDPNVAAEYAGNAAGMDAPTATRLSNHLRGVLEQPSVGDIDDAAGVGMDAQPYRTGAPNVSEPQKRLFQSALASTIANRIATGKTNAAQLAQSGDRLNETALTNQAANEPDVPTANRIVAAVSGRLRNPYRTNAQGTVINQETGDLDESTRLAGAVRALSGARAATEGARQTELGTRSTRNEAMATLAGARTGAVNRGETNRGGARTSPQQIEKWVSETARKEWEAIPARERKGMNFNQHLETVRARFTGTNGIEQDSKDALEAINKGAPSKAVHERFEKRWGKKLIEVVPDATDSGLGAGEDALDEED